MYKNTYIYYVNLAYLNLMHSKYTHTKHICLRALAHTKNDYAKNENENLRQSWLGTNINNNINNNNNL